MRTNANGSLACIHRDLSVCQECATLPNVREIMGAHYLLTDSDYAAISALLA